MEDLEKLNSITKYPSIGTYHELTGKGTLTDNVLEPITKPLIGYVTEKIDGTNTRIIINGNDYFIGSREQLLYAKGDRIKNNTLGIVEELIPVAEKISSRTQIQYDIFVIYGEVYGYNIGRNYKNYTNSKDLDFRVFDIQLLKLEIYNKLLNETVDKISNWRENNSQHFFEVHNIVKYCDFFNLLRVPPLGVVNIDQLPQDVKGMYDYISSWDNTLAGFDAHGKSEGVVIRSEDRNYIRKLRFEEYRKTLGIR